MKRIIAAVAILLAAGACAVTSAPAPSATRPVELSKLASVFANRYVKIECHSVFEDQTMANAWGYVFVPPGEARIAYIWDEACEGALAIASDDPDVTDYMKVNGIATVVHEAYHMRRIKGNQDEALTECRAMRKYDVALRLAGATEKVMDRLMPLILLEHWRFRATVPQYNRKGCPMPTRYDKWVGYPPR